MLILLLGYAAGVLRNTYIESFDAPLDPRQRFQPRQLRWTIFLSPAALHCLHRGRSWGVDEQTGCAGDEVP